ncbi:MAG: hypothetical protein JW788_05360 [Candidatus Omnitrophica bacterium]|nr:hypothetical protein [Candidatus Omnitrophota bacterium]
MNDKDRYIFLELLSSFILLEAVVFLFGGILENLGPYLSFGLIFGFYFSWLVRNKKLTFLKPVINAGILLTFGWMVYSLVASSAIYTRMIIILVKSLFLLEIILSFSGGNQDFMTYLEILSLPLFLSSFLFIESYNFVHGLLILAYITSWALILRAKFLASQPEKRFKGRQSNLIFLSFFLVIIIVSHTLFTFRLSGKKQYEGIFFSREAKGLLEEKSLERSYYGFQEELQKRVALLVDEAAPEEDRDGIIEAQSSLISAQDIADINKSEVILAGYFERLGAGMGEVLPQESADLVKQYVSKMIQFKLKKTRDEINRNLLKSPFRVMQRILILARAIKIQYTQSYPKALQYEKETQRIIEKSPVDEPAKNELNGLFDSLIDWKVFEIYRNKMEGLKEKIEAMQPAAKKEFRGLFLRIEKIQSIADFRSAENHLKAAKERFSKDAGGVVKEMEEALAIASDYLILGMKKDLKKRIEDSRLPPDDLKKLSKELADITEAQALKEFFSKVLEIQKKTGVEIMELGKQVLQKKESALDRIRLSPDHLKIPMGQTGQLAAIGTYADGSTEDLTFLADWEIIDNGVASMISGRVLPHSIGTTGVYASFKEKRSLPATVSVEEARLVSIILTPRSFSLFPEQGLKLKAEGYFTDKTEQDITSLAQWKADKPGIIAIEKGVVKPLGVGRIKAYALYQGIESNPADIKVAVSLAWLLRIITKIIILCLSCISALLLLFYFLTEIEKKKIKVLLRDPNAFVVRLYENTKKILSLFGLKLGGSLAPLAYGRLIEDKYSVKDDLFMRLTIKFTEAKYSRHVLEAKDVRSALEGYNGFLKILFSRFPKRLILLKFCLALFFRIPLFIKA